MTGQSFALVGRTFASDAFAAVRLAATAARRARGGAWDADVRPRPVWRGSNERGPFVWETGARRGSRAGAEKETVTR